MLDVINIYVKNVTIAPGLPYLAIDSGGNVSDFVLARNCCLARMLPGD